MLAVRRLACVDARGFDPALRRSINIAAAQLDDAALEPLLLAVLQETGFNPRRLEIELTAHALERDIGAARGVIAAWKAADMTIALDDFDTGYSSLAYLSDLPFDKLKIDRSFVRTLRARRERQGGGRDHRPAGQPGCAGHRRGRGDRGDAGALQRLGCELAQGYRFARPMPAAPVARATGRVGLGLEMA